MKAIVAVYSDWGIGRDGTQPIALMADRKFFRAQTKGACVIVGRRTLADFPGGQPLPKRVNLVLTRGECPVEGVEVCPNVEAAVQRASEFETAFVIGGGSVYRQMLPWCDEVLVTKLDVNPGSDTFFPNLDESAEWKLAEILQEGTEDGVTYRMCRYVRV